MPERSLLDSEAVTLQALIPAGRSQAPRVNPVRNMNWLSGIILLQVLIIVYLLWTRANRKTTQQLDARDSEFQNILAMMAAEPIAVSETNELQWPPMFLHYFGFEWASFVDLADDDVSTNPGSHGAWVATSKQPVATVETGNASDVDVTVFGADADEIMEKLTGLRKLLAQHGSESCVIVPLRIRGELLGALVCAHTGQQPLWPGKRKHELQIVASVLANTLRRTRAETALRFSEALKASILSSFTSSVAVIDRTGTILAVNRRWSELGAKAGVDSGLSSGPGANYLEECERASAHGDPYAQHALLGIRDVLEGRREIFELAYASHPPDQERWFNMIVTPLIGAADGAVIKHNDITEQATARLMLEESEHRFRVMADTAPVMMWMSGLDRLCTYFNRGWLDFTGRSLEQELGNGWAQGVHPNDLEKCIETYFASFNGRRKFTMEYRLRRSDGQYRWIVDSGVPRFVNDSFAGYIGCCFDITDRMELAATRTEFAGRLIKAQEVERARIARELHDDIGQRLALIAIEVQELDKGFSGSREAIHAKLHGLWKQINDISTDAGRISHQLHSSKLQILGLAASIRGLCHDVARQHHLPITCNSSALPEPIENDISLSLFRVAQEALHNIVRHSKAKNVTVEINGVANGIQLDIHDDGTGFDVDSALAGESLGLISMMERLRLVRGNLIIRSETSFGTDIDAFVPLTASAFSDSVPDQPNKNAAFERRVAASRASAMTVNRNTSCK